MEDQHRGTNQQRVIGRLGGTIIKRQPGEIVSHADDLVDPSSLVEYDHVGTTLDDVHRLSLSQVLVRARRFRPCAR